MSTINYYFVCCEQIIQLQCHGNEPIKEDKFTINMNSILFVDRENENENNNIHENRLLEIAFSCVQQNQQTNIQLEILYDGKEEKLQISAQYIYQIYMMKPYIYILSDQGVHIFSEKEMYLYHTLFFKQDFSAQLVNLNQDAIFIKCGIQQITHASNKYLYIYKSIQIIECQLNFKAFIIQNTGENILVEDENSSEIKYQQLQFSISPVLRIQALLEHDLSIESQIVEITSYDNMADQLLLRICLYLKIKSEIKQTFALQYDILFESLQYLANQQEKQQQERFLKNEDIVNFNFKILKSDQFLLPLQSNNKGNVYIYDQDTNNIININ